MLECRQCPLEQRCPRPGGNDRDRVNRRTGPEFLSDGPSEFCEFPLVRRNLRGARASNACLEPRQRPPRATGCASIGCRNAVPHGGHPRGLRPGSSDHEPMAAPFDFVRPADDGAGVVCRLNDANRISVLSSSGKNRISGCDWIVMTDLSASHVESACSLRCRVPERSPQPASFPCP